MGSACLTALRSPKPSISEVVSSVRAGNVREITVSGQKVEVIHHDDSIGELRKDAFAAFDETLINLGVTADQLSFGHVPC